MVSITLSVPEEVKEEMDSFIDVNWSAVAREAIKNKLQLLNKFREFTKNSKLTETDALELGRKVNRAVAARYKSLA